MVRKGRDKPMSRESVLVVVPLVRVTRVVVQWLVSLLSFLQSLGWPRL